MEKRYVPAIHNKHGFKVYMIRATQSRNLWVVRGQSWQGPRTVELPLEPKQTPTPYETPVWHPHHDLSLLCFRLSSTEGWWKTTTEDGLKELLDEGRPAGRPAHFNWSTSLEEFRFAVAGSYYMYIHRYGSSETQTRQQMQGQLAAYLECWIILYMLVFSSSNLSQWIMSIEVESCKKIAHWSACCKTRCDSMWRWIVN
jgi:hypothetical protein